MSRITVSYRGLDNELDRTIEAVAPRNCVGSGYGLGERSFSFVFKTKKAFESNLKKFEKMAEKQETSIEIDDDPE